MALLKSGSYKASGTVDLDYRLYAEQTGGSGTSRTIKVTVEFKCGGNTAYPSWWGYAMDWRPYVNSTYGSWAYVKGTESWNTNNSFRSYSQTITVNVGTTSSTSVTVGFSTDSHGDNGWDGGASASFGVSSTNTAPWFQAVDKVTADSTTGNKYIPENQGSIKISWPTAYDNDGNLAGYRIRVSINGGGYSEIARTNTSTRTYTHNVAGYGTGSSFKYAIDAFDYASVWSGSIYSGIITKNSLTAANLTAPSSIVWNTESLSFSWSGASNKVSNTTFTYDLTCKQFTLYRGSGVKSPVTVPIVTTAPASGPYILKNDLINSVKSSSYKGTITFNLKTTNAYGSSGSTNKNTSVNMQSPPATPKPVINTADDSPDSLNIWRTAADTKNRYMIPDGTRRIRVSWPAVVGSVGESISYDVFYRLDGGGYISLGNQSGTSYNLVLPTQEKMRTINFMVRAKSEYGLVSADGVSLGQNLHYYRSPYLVFGKLTRTDTQATLQVRVKSESSIPNINTKGTYVNTTLGGTAVALPLSQADFSTLSFSGLASNGSYTITFVYNDSTGFTTANTTETYKIGPNLPAFFVNKYGIGVGGEKADTTNALRVKGGAYVNGLTTVSGNANITGNMNAGSITTTGSATMYGDAIVGPNARIKSLNNTGVNIDGPTTVDNNFGFNVKRTDGTHMARMQAAVAANEVLYGVASGANSDIISPYLRLGINADTDGNYRLAFNNANIVNHKWGTDGSLALRFYDGTQICIIEKWWSTPFTSTWGNLYATGYISVGTWPMAFVSGSYLHAFAHTTNAGSGSSSAFAGAVQGVTTTSAGKVELYRGAGLSSTPVDLYVKIICFGRWK